MRSLSAIRKKVLIEDILPRLSSDDQYIILQNWGISKPDPKFKEYGLTFEGKSVMLHVIERKVIEMITLAVYERQKKALIELVLPHLSEVEQQIIRLLLGMVERMKRPLQDAARLQGMSKWDLILEIFDLTGSLTKSEAERLEERVDRAIHLAVMNGFYQEPDMSDFDDPIDYEYSASEYEFGVLQYLAEH